MFRIELPVPGARYEAALVFGLPQPVAAAVKCLRIQLAWEAPGEYQLTPHITVLFLGRIEGARLLDLHRALSWLRPVEIEVKIGGFGTFVSGSKVTNLHLRVLAGTAIRNLHHRALETCRAVGWEPQTPYLGDRYEPHISIFDRVDVEVDRLILPTPPPNIAGTVTLHDLHLFAKRIRPDGSTEISRDRP